MIFNFTMPKQEYMHCIKSKERKLRFETISDQFSSLDINWRKYFNRNPIAILYLTKLEAFKSILSEKEQNLTEEEINQKYPFWKNKIYYFNTRGWLVFHKDKQSHYLMKYIHNKSAPIYYKCKHCQEEKHMTEFNWRKDYIQYKPGKVCPACREKKRMRKKGMFKNETIQS